MAVASVPAMFAPGQIEYCRICFGICKNGRPYVVYKEGGVEIGGGEPVPAWWNEWCVCTVVCKCGLVGFRGSRG